MANERLFSVRGAVCLAADNAEEMRGAVGELLTLLLSKNSIQPDLIVNILFSQTQDLVNENPARALRRFGFPNVPLFCSCEPVYPDTLPKTVRVLLTYYNSPDHRPSPVYIRGAEALRADLFPGKAQV